MKNTAIVIIAAVIGLTGCAGSTSMRGNSDSHHSKFKPEDRKELNSKALQHLEQKLDRKIKFIAMVDEKHPHQVAYMYKDGKEESQADRDELYCKGKKNSPPEYPSADDPKCWCQSKGGDGDGLHEDTHMHCY